MDWLLDAMDEHGGMTLPPLELLLESSMFRRGSHNEDAVGQRGVSSSEQNLALESFHEWAMSLETSTVAATSNNNQRASKAGKERLQKKNALVSPYVAHKSVAGAGSDRPSMEVATPTDRKKIAAARQQDTLRTYMAFLHSAQGAGDVQDQDQDQSRGQNQDQGRGQGQAGEAKKRLQLAIAAHISREASSRNRSKMVTRPAKKRESWSTPVSCRGSFEELAKAKEKEALTQQIFAAGGSLRVANANNHGGADLRSAVMQVQQDDIEGFGSSSNNMSRSLLENAHPTSNHDPLYRIMREESELAIRRHRQSQPEGAATMQSEASRSRAAAVYDNAARRQLREQSAASTQMVRAAELAALRGFATVDSDMWVQLRAVFFLFVSYHELLSSRGALSSSSIVDSLGPPGSEHVVLPRLVRSEPPAATDMLGDEELFRSLSSSINMNLLWEAVGRQCAEYDMTAASVADKFSWPMFRALLDFPHELSCALVYIERGEEAFDDQVAALLAGRRTAVDFWREGFFYQAFPEDHLSHLRSVVAPSVFHPVATVVKSPACARLCAWARRVTAGLFAAKMASLRSGLQLQQPFEGGSGYMGLASIDDASLKNDEGMSFLQVGDAAGSLETSSMHGSVFERSSISAQSPRRRIEQFIHYPGTAAGAGGGGIMMGTASELDEDKRAPRRRSLSVVAAVPISLAEEEGSLDEHVCVFNATMLLARPLDRVDVCLLRPPSGQFSGGASLDEYSAQMLQVFAKGYYESRIVALSHSPLHRVLVDEASARTDDGSEGLGFEAVTVSFNDTKGWTQGRAANNSASVDVDPLAHALRDSVRADLLVVGIAGLPSSAERADLLAANQTCSVALVFGRHWALAFRSENFTWPISRFVVFVSASPASRAAFLVSPIPPATSPYYLHLVLTLPLSNSPPCHLTSPPLPTPSSRCNSPNPATSSFSSTPCRGPRPRSRSRPRTSWPTTASRATTCTWTRPRTTRAGRAGRARTLVPPSWPCAWWLRRASTSPRTCSWAPTPRTWPLRCASARWVMRREAGGAMLPGRWLHT